MPDARNFGNGLVAVGPASEKWWITDGNLADGARKVLGPFESRDLALTVRRLYEASPEAKGLTYWVSQEGTGWAS